LVNVGDLFVVRNVTKRLREPHEPADLVILCHRWMMLHIRSARRKATSAFETRNKTGGGLDTQGEFHGFSRNVAAAISTKVASVNRPPGRS
jgi:hypothetical protein